jgi:hypothetical protein
MRQVNQCFHILLEKSITSLIHLLMHQQPALAILTIKDATDRSVQRRLVHRKAFSNIKN